MKTPSDINPLIIDRAGLTVAQVLADNEDRWNELYAFLGVVRVAQTSGNKLVAQLGSQFFRVGVPPAIPEKFRQ